VLVVSGSGILQTPAVCSTGRHPRGRRGLSDACNRCANATAEMASAATPLTSSSFRAFVLASSCVALELASQTNSASMVMSSAGWPARSFATRNPLTAWVQGLSASWTWGGPRSGGTFGSRRPLIRGAPRQSAFSGGASLSIAGLWQALEGEPDPAARIRAEHLEDGVIAGAVTLGIPDVDVSVTRTLVYDTGSSNTWIFADAFPALRDQLRTAHGVDAGQQTIDIHYGSGSVRGVVALVDVVLGGRTFPRAPVAVVDRLKAKLDLPAGVVGIVGLGFAGLSVQGLAPVIDSLQPRAFTFSMDGADAAGDEMLLGSRQGTPLSLREAGVRNGADAAIPDDRVGASTPSASTVDSPPASDAASSVRSSQQPSRAAGDALEFTASESLNYWLVDVASSSVGGQRTCGPAVNAAAGAPPPLPDEPCSAIIDSGTSFIGMPSHAFEAFDAAVRAAYTCTRLASPGETAAGEQSDPLAGLMPTTYMTCECPSGDLSAFPNITLAFPRLTGPSAGLQPETVDITLTASDYVRLLPSWTGTLCVPLVLPNNAQKLGISLHDDAYILGWPLFASHVVAFEGELPSDVAALQPSHKQARIGFSRSRSPAQITTLPLPVRLVIFAAICIVEVAALAAVLQAAWQAACGCSLQACAKTRCRWRCGRL